MIEKLKDFANRLNKLGVPTPMLRDPKTGVASVSLTMMFISFTLCAVGLLGKASGFLGGVDLSQALTLLGITSSLYFARNFNSKSGDSAISEEKKEE